MWCWMVGFVLLKNSNAVFHILFVILWLNRKGLRSFKELRFGESAIGEPQCRIGDSLWHWLCLKSTLFWWDLISPGFIAALSLVHDMRLDSDLFPHLCLSVAEEGGAAEPAWAGTPAEGGWSAVSKARAGRGSGETPGSGTAAWGDLQTQLWVWNRTVIRNETGSSM